LQRTLDTTELVLDAADLEAEQVDSVVLVGGSTLIPAVARSLKEIVDVEPFQGLSPHTAVAQGAAIHAAILEAKYRGEDGDMSQAVRERLKDVRQENVNSHGLGVIIRSARTNKPRNYLMIPRNTKIPASVSKQFSTQEENQRRVSVKVVEGDAPDPDACSLIGVCRVTDLPKGLPKGAPIEVTYAFDASGRVEVTARDKTGGQEATIQIEREGLLDETQVDDYSKLADGYQVE
ncbi:MAG: heat shock 70 family protein, partial [Planctomycetales bacterium]